MRCSQSAPAYKHLLRQAPGLSKSGSVQSEVPVQSQTCVLYFTHLGGRSYPSMRSTARHDALSLQCSSLMCFFMLSTQTQAANVASSSVGSASCTKKSHPNARHHTAHPLLFQDVSTAQHKSKAVSIRPRCLLWTVLGNH